jgi:hypothetical protein
MPRLSLRRTVRDERGASAVLVALLMVPLIGFAALAVDIAAVYSERQQLQSGADAAALAIGHDCADGSCDLDPQATADDLGDANYDEAGSVRGTSVVAIDMAASEVTVTNPGTQDHWFAPVLGETSTDVSASATVRWGAPGGGAAVLPLALSYCAFQQQTGGGLPTAETPQVIDFTKADETEGCTGPSNLEVPGGFAWLDTDPGVCGATTTVDGVVGSSTGNSVPQECTPEYFEGLIGQTVLLPIFDAEGGTGSNAEYTIYGYAAFTLTGYNFGGQYKSTPTVQCGGTGSSGRCIEGFFTMYVDSTDDFDYDPTAPDLGGRVVQLVA